MCTGELPIYNIYIYIYSLCKRYLSRGLVACLPWSACALLVDEQLHKVRKGRLYCVIIFIVAAE